MTSTTFAPEKDCAQVAAETGFTGTFSAFLDWLNDSLVYGGIVVYDATNVSGRDVIRVEAVTAGYSSDEQLLGRIRQSVLPSYNWVSSHRGGRDVYEFPKGWKDSDEESEFVAPEDGVFQRVHRARRIQLVTENGDRIDVNFDAGAELVFEEPDRDINEPDGVLTIRPIDAAHSVFI
jgi:hypothetical protein